MTITAINNILTIIYHNNTTDANDINNNIKNHDITNNKNKSSCCLVIHQNDFNFGNICRADRRETFSKSFSLFADWH